MSKMVEVEVFYGDVPRGLSIKGFCDWLAERLSEIPEDLRGSEAVSLDAENDDCGPEGKLSIKYSRPETEEEAALRRANAALSLERKLRRLEAEAEWVKRELEEKAA